MRRRIPFAIDNDGTDLMEESVQDCSEVQGM